MTSTENTTATQGMLSKIRAMLDTAESLRKQAAEHSGCATCDQGKTDHRTDLNAAADTYEAKAHALRDKYAVEEEALIAKEPTSVLPVYEEIVVVARGSKFQQEYVNMFHYVAKHAGLRQVFEWKHVPGEGYAVTACVVGYESDIRYAELLYTNARLVFSEKLEPRVNPALSEQVNVYRLRGAGIERVRVADMMWGSRDKANLGKVGRLYKAECKARGEEALLSGRGVTGAVYREQYATEFVWTLDRRLRRAQDAAGQFGGGLVLHGRSERVDAAFYERYPHLRPKPAIEQATEQECERCKAAKAKRGADATCKDHKPWKPTAADIRRSERYYSPAAVRGRSAGATAAAHVELNRTGRNGLEG